MISVTQLRSGVNFIHNNTPFRVLEYNHTHMGRGGGTIRVKAKNLHTGAVLNLSFKSGDKVEDIEVNKKQVQFAYKDGDEFIFMDQDTFESIPVKKEVMPESAVYLSEGLTVWLHIWDKEIPEVLDVDLPAKVEVVIKDAAPGEKGNSAANIYKDGILENGAKVRIPLFVNKGDKIKISTIDGSYVERA